jgi:hypothetical protein
LLVVPPAPVAPAPAVPDVAPSFVLPHATSVEENASSAMSLGKRAFKARN